MIDTWIHILGAVIIAYFTALTAAVAVHRWGGGRGTQGTPAKRPPGYVACATDTLAGIAIGTTKPLTPYDTLPCAYLNNARALLETRQLKEAYNTLSRCTLVILNPDELSAHRLSKRILDLCNHARIESDSQNRLLISTAQEGGTRAMSAELVLRVALILRGSLSDCPREDIAWAVYDTVRDYITEVRRV
jgi:hypothetical protein